MGLVDKLNGMKKYAGEIRSREQFRDIYLDDLMRSGSLKGYFFKGAEKKDDDHAKYLESELTRMLDDAYVKYGQKTIQEQGMLRRFIAKPLRKLGVATVLGGHYMLNTLFFQGSSAYALGTVGGIGMMIAADLAEGASYLYHNHSGYDLMQIPKIIAEGAIEKGLAIIPIYVTAGLEATLGDTKFDRAVARKVIYKARNDFIRKFGDYKASDHQYEPEIFRMEEDRRRRPSGEYRPSVMPSPGMPMPDRRDDGGEGRYVM